jgi:hypothetical protein
MATTTTMTHCVFVPITGVAAIENTLRRGPRSGRVRPRLVGRGRGQTRLRSVGKAQKQSAAGDLAAHPPSVTRSGVVWHRWPRSFLCGLHSVQVTRLHPDPHHSPTTLIVARNQPGHVRLLLSQLFATCLCLFTGHAWRVRLTSHRFPCMGRVRPFEVAHTPRAFPRSKRWFLASVSRSVGRQVHGTLAEARHLVCRRRLGASWSRVHASAEHALVKRRVDQGSALCRRGYRAGGTRSRVRHPLRWLLAEGGDLRCAPGDRGLV